MKSIEARTETAKQALTTFSQNWSIVGAKDALARALDDADLPSKVLRHMLVTMVYTWGAELRNQGAGILNSYIDAAMAKELIDAQTRSAKATTFLAWVNVGLAAVGVLLTAVQVFAVFNGH